MLKKIFSIEGIENFFNVYDDDGDFSWEQVFATTIQLLLILGTLFALVKMGLIG